MITNAAGIALIKKFESLRLTAYFCPAGVATVGYGHTGPDVRWGLKVTPTVAEQLLRADLVQFEKAVTALLDVPVNDNEFSALVCLTFNIGTARFAESTMLKLLNWGDAIGASQEFPKWNKAKGVVLPGLVVRREAERELFLKPVESA